MSKKNISSSISRFKGTRLYCTLSSSFVGLIAMVIMVSIFALIISKISAPTPVIAFMATVSLCIGAFVSGYLCSRKRRQNGLLFGLVCGCLVFCAVFLLGVFFANSVISFSKLTKFFLTLICGAIGGIFGVNSKKKRY